MKIRPARLGTWGEEGGQALVLLVFFILFVFVGLTALAIDGGLVYVARRDLQNRADTACLAAAEELALGGSPEGARTAAIANITANNGSSDLYAPSSGSGADLVRGIAINGSDVRVALQTTVPGFLSNLLGRQGWVVPARAHCDSVGGGGLLPLAVKRYGEDTLNQNGWIGWEGDDGSTVDCTSPGEGYSCDTRYNLEPQGPGSTPGNVVDFSARYYESPAGPAGPGRDVLWQWPEWGTPTYPGDPRLGSGLYSPPAYPAADAPNGWGRAFAMLGEGASPNVSAGMDFRNFVALDVRCLTCPVTRYIPPIQPGTSVNTLKDVARSYIQQRGYTGPTPLPGEQIAVLSGTDASQAARSMAEAYAVGEVVPVLVYSGQVMRRPNFDVNITPENISRDIASGGITYPNYAQYSVALCPVNGFLSPSVSLTAYLGDPNGRDPGLRWGVASWSPSQIQSQRTLGIVDTNCVSASLYVWQEFGPLDGAQVVFVDAYDPYPGTQIRRLGHASVEVTPTQDFQFTISNPYRVVERPTSGNENIDWELQFQPVGSGAGTIEPQTPYWSDFQGDPGGVAPSGVTLSLRRQGSRWYLRATLSSSATLGSFYITVPAVNNDVPADRHLAVVEMTIKEAAVGQNASGIESYVVVLGYGLIEIERFDANSVIGHFVESLFTDPSLITRGFRPRLLPW